MLFLLVPLVSFAIALLSVGWIKERFRQALLDLPNERSAHTQPTPRGGGLGFIIGFAIACLVALVLNPFSLLGVEPFFVLQLWLVLIPLAVVGMIDDRGNVPAAVRYLVQLLAAGIAVAGFGIFPQPWLTQWGGAGVGVAVALTMIGITATINFYNFMDGLDGLVAGVTAVQLGFLALELDQPLFWGLVAALGGFLVWNWSPAKIFMGDVGSTVLGASVAIALLQTNSTTQAWSTLAVTLPIVGDAIYTLVRRLLRQENIFKAHRSHLYQRLQQAGWSHAQVATTYIAIAAGVALAISTLGAVGSWLSLVGVVGAIGLGEVYLQWKRQLSV